MIFEQKPAKNKDPPTPNPRHRQQLLLLRLAGPGGCHRGRLLALGLRLGPLRSGCGGGIILLAALLTGTLLALANMLALALVIFLVACGALHKHIRNTDKSVGIVPLEQIFAGSLRYLEQLRNLSKALPERPMLGLGDFVAEVAVADALAPALGVDVDYR
jgi:hypothetical protein